MAIFLAAAAAADTRSPAAAMEDTCPEPLLEWHFGHDKIVCSKYSSWCAYEILHPDSVICCRDTPEAAWWCYTNNVWKCESILECPDTVNTRHDCPRLQHCHVHYDPVHVVYRFGFIGLFVFLCTAGLCIMIFCLYSIRPDYYPITYYYEDGMVIFASPRKSSDVEEGSPVSPRRHARRPRIPSLFNKKTTHPDYEVKSAARGCRMYECRGTIETMDHNRVPTLKRMCRSQMYPKKRSSRRMQM